MSCLILVMILLASFDQSQPESNTNLLLWLRVPFWDLKEWKSVFLLINIKIPLTISTQKKATCIQSSIGLNIAL